ncbi:MAG: hypothetical protein IJ724_09790, partial [Muribaculaceae bacterium]|nr:hypothetical protein [Muribaculaceae bacterium]
CKSTNFNFIDSPKTENIAKPSAFVTIDSTKSQKKERRIALSLLGWQSVRLPYHPQPLLA